MDPATLAALSIALEEYREEQKEPMLELTLDGWRVTYPDKSVIKLTVKQAYIASDFDQDVLDETRVLCGRLRLMKRTDILRKLRHELTQARKLKEERG